MNPIRRRSSMLRLTAELVEDIAILGFIEVKRAFHEIKRNILSVEKGALLLLMGAGLLLFAALLFTGTAVAILAIFLPVWLAALIVTLVLGFLGVTSLLTGLGHFKDFHLIPSETIERVEHVFKDYRKVSARHHEMQAALQVEPGRRRAAR